MNTQKASILTAMLLLPLLSFADGARYVTMTVAALEGRETNQVLIASEEIGQLVSFNGSSMALAMVKDGFTFYPFWVGEPGVNTNPPMTLVGPAAFNLSVTSKLPQAGGFATFKITPGSFPPNKTLIVEPNQGNVAITMESSTNLIHWLASTNGIYNTSNTATFFRVRMDKGQ